MATITIPQGTAGAAGQGHAALYGRATRSTVKIVDLVNAAAVKGSDLAQDDVIQAVAIPAKSFVKSVFVRTIEAHDVDNIRIDVGTGVDPDAYVDAQLMTTANGGFCAPTEGAMGRSTITQASTGTITNANITGTLNFMGTYDTIDITLSSFTGTAPTAGQLAVYVEWVDLATPQGANITDV
jgi:hypothetical protein